MKIFKFILLFVFCIEFSVLARGRAAPVSDDGGFIFMPSLGYSSGVLTQSGVADIGTMSANVEIMLGYKFGDLLTGVSYLLGTGNSEQFSVKGDFKPTDMAIVVGYKLPLDLKIYAGYSLTSTAKIQSSDNPANFTGSGYKVALSWSWMSHADLALDYTNRSYTKYDGTSLTNQLKSTSTGFSFSFPF
jgi:hypothetical protein